MPVKLQDMSLYKNAIPLSQLNEGARTLVSNIINESNASNIAWGGGGRASKQAFFNHGYDKDPATNGGKLALHIEVSIYYMPSTAREYNRWDVVDSNEGLLSGRRRLAVRVENEKYSFYTTSHPQEDPRLRTNVYGLFIPIDPKK
jgi:hypothetical protein